jgi:hypothetical protein
MVLDLIISEVGIFNTIFENLKRLEPYSAEIKQAIHNKRTKIDALYSTPGKNTHSCQIKLEMPLIFTKRKKQ